MLRRTTLRYFTNTRLGGRLLTTSAGALSAGTTSIPSTRISTSTPTSTTTSQSSDYTPGTVKPAQQWHQKTDGSSSGTGGASVSGGGGGRPARGGQNLSARYARLENAVRGKQARAEAQAVNVSGAAATVAATSTAMGTAPDPAGEASVVAPDIVPQNKGDPVEMFRGLVVPEEPKPPADDECCMSGCAVCVYDLHEEELEAYETALTTLRTSLVTLGVPQAQWPARVRPVSTSTSTANVQTPSSNSAAAQSQDKSRKGAVLNAFEEMERRLAEKHRAEDQTQADADAGSETGAGTATGVGAGVGMEREEKQGVQAQAVASISPNGQELHWNVNSITDNAVPHWRERQQLAAKTQQAARRRTFWTELYEGVRWVLFSNR